MQLTASFIGCCLCIFLVYHIKPGRLQGFLSYVGMYTLEIYVLHFKFATILNLADKNLVLTSSAGIFWVVLTFFVMSVFTAFFIFTIKKLAIVDLLMFGKRHDSYTIKLPGIK